jgi:hypothetical protein
MLSLTLWIPAFRGAWGRAAALAAAFAALIGILLGTIRPWYSSWGTDEQERHAYLPGDELIANSPRETRAISIAAPAHRVFAWVAQLGQDRAGFYSYELLEDLAGCEMPNITHLDPALQRWAPGDKLWMYPPSKLDGMGRAELLDYQPGRALVFGTSTPLDPVGAPPSGTWAFIVQPTSEEASRLIIRSSGRPPPNLLGTAFNRAVFEPVHFAMERRTMEGIRGLAEGRLISRLRDNVMISLWVLTFGAFLAAAVLVMIGARWQRRLIAFVAAGVVFQVLTLAQPSLLFGIPVVLALLFFTWAPRLGSGEEAVELSGQQS